MAWPMRALLLLLTALMVVLARSASAQSRKTSSGDIHAADLNDKSVQRVLNFTIREYNKDISKDEYYSRPLQVMAAYQQEEFCSFQINEVSQENKISILNYKCRKV
ncbi:cystatin-D isoform X2 [Macaca fascicularis]|uniref:cystatin-D isoform X2 n=1 Tax=Macaca fascicularis TaxID=9541 RepID=UPI003D157BD8